MENLLSLAVFRNTQKQRAVDDDVGGLLLLPASHIQLTQDKLNHLFVFSVFMLYIA